MVPCPDLLLPEPVSVTTSGSGAERPCVFTAGLAGSVDVVVKFAQSYCADAHVLLAEKGWAPPLYYCGRLPKHPGWFLVVMAYIEPKTAEVQQPTPAVRGQAAEALSILHAAGYVWGDVRPANVIVDRDDKLWLIDIDWSGLENRVFWPPSRNSTIAWPLGSETSTPITKAEDQFMLGIW